MDKVSKKRFLLIVMAGILIFGGWIILSGQLERYIFKPTDSNLPAGTQSGQRDEANIKIAAVDLNIPWAIAELPGGDLLVTERAGKLKRVGSDRQSIEISGVEHSGEGGLLGLALHPDFAENNKIYLYLTTRTDAGLINRVESYIYKNGGLSEKTIIIDQIPGARFHDGGFIAFGPDDKLYITTGDAGDEQSAQDTSVLSGKILRINADGSIPGDNPFNNAVYSYGHRNPQGLAWDDRDRLWSSEHGPSG
ncbi:PQQ-dependent sugar dehydrogenase, partial [Candidatus Parcubacteria bacterium]|nr:PQQ-dependent sugar dehydrogenase [Candidatus Parcubacteria bacterium]